MFGFFKKKKSTEVAVSTEEDKEYDGKSVAKTASGFAVTESARVSIQQAAEKFAKPDSYTGNRSLYDSGAAKRQAKVDLFSSGKEVIDPYTGDKLVLTKGEARARYGADWQKHLAESDHVKPLEQVYNDTKGDVWLSTDDIKTAANSSDNIKVASRKFNNPKRSRTNQEYVEDDAYLESKGVSLTKQGKKQAIKDGELAEESISKQIKQSAVKNIVSTGHEAGMMGAQNAGIMTGTMSGIMNMVAVIKGEKDAEEAISDTIVDGGKAAVTGYTISGGLTVVSHSLSNSSSQFIQALTESNIPGKVITAVIVTGDTLKKYSNGEISTQECLLELGEKGLNFATTGYSMAVGQALIPIPIVGAAVGALVGSVATSKYYSQLVNELKTKELEHQERLRIISECEQATAQARAYREELESYLQEYFRDYQGCFDEALSEIHSAFQLGDADGVIAGANKITRKLGGKVKYETVAEFDDFLNDDAIDIL